jgi:zincin-like metallopeptidase/antirestriction factor ArdC-like protein/transposase
MECYVGLDVSLKQTSICVVNQAGSIVQEGVVDSDPDAIAEFVRSKAPGAVQIGLETGPTTTWLWTELKRLGLPVICIDARHAKAVLKMQINKSDRNDAAGIARIMQTGWFKEVRVKDLDSHSVIPYQGINVLMLWSEAIEKGYAAPIWMTFKQALSLNAAVRKGEHGSLVVYADKITRTETDRDTGEDTEREITFMKGYTVFNVEQVEGLPEHYYAKPAPRAEAVRRIDRAESFFAATGAKIINGGNVACYAVSADIVRIPCIEFFRDSESYYATLAHEVTHWTRHVSRLNRDFGRKRFGDEGYAMEELVAELTSLSLSRTKSLA